MIQLPPTARLWVYASARPLTDDEAQWVEDQGKAFVSSWAAHGAPMKASVTVRDQHFILLSADEEVMQATGCSIDASVRFFKAIGEELGVDLFDRMTIFYRTAEGNLQSAKMTDIPALVEAKTLQADTLVVNTLVETMSDLDSKWMVPMDQSWMGRYL